MNLRNTVLGLSVLLLLALTAAPSEGQIHRYFQSNMKNTQFTDLPGARIVLPVQDFVDPATRFVDPDNGYYYANSRFGIDLGFSFEYEGQRYNRIHINVNGYCLFSTVPPFTGSDLPIRLFFKDPPNTVVAPFWGDHYYRDGTGGFLPSEISILEETIVGSDGITNVKVFTIQWKDLNINYFFDANDPNNPLSPDASAKPSSVGTFQLKLYESAAEGDPVIAPQGNIEFHYSTVGNPLVPGAVKTSGSSVGLESHPFGQAPTSFMNGLFIDNLDPFIGRTNEDGIPANTRTRTDFTSTWSPSRANNNVICYVATPRPGKLGWGDGDANLSQLRGNKHFLLPQNEFVTMSDVITIMRSVVEFKPLDSSILREAYHGDVNHNGRYYYSNRNADNTADVPRHRRDVPIRSENEFQDIPEDNSFIASQLYFEANSFDAAMIVNYMAGRVPVLPWRLDSVVPFGKLALNRVLPNTLNVANVQRIDGRTYRIPLSFDGSVDGALGMEFSVNASIVDLEGLEREGTTLLALHGNNKVSIAGSGDFSEGTVLAYLTVQTDEEVLELSGLEVNDIQKGSVQVPLTNESSVSVVSFPNPFSERTDITVDVPTKGEYSLTIFDMMGTAVADVATLSLDQGQHSFSWNGADAAGNLQPAGVYYFRFEGAGIVYQGNLTIVR